MKQMLSIKCLKQNSPHLQYYDHMKDSLKKAHSPVTAEFLQLQANLQTKTLKHITLMKNEFEKWEKAFKVEHDYFPEMRDVESDIFIFDIFNRIKIAEKLVKNRGITL